MTQRTKSALGIIALAAIFTLYRCYTYFSETAPKFRAEVAAKETELAQKQSELRKLNEFVKNLELVKQELKELNLQLESALEHMPRLFQFSSLFRRMTLLAQASGVDLTTFKPRNREEKAPAGFYSSIPLEIQLVGTFTQQLTFFDQVSRLRRIVNVESILMTPNPATGIPRGSSIPLTSVVSLRTYRFLE